MSPDDADRKAEWDAYYSREAELRADLEAAIRRIAELEEQKRQLGYGMLAAQDRLAALRAYVQHQPACELRRDCLHAEADNVRVWAGPVQGWRPAQCSCGLSALLGEPTGRETP